MEEERKTEKVKVKGFSRPITEEDLECANLVIETFEEKGGDYVKEDKELLEKCKDKTTGFPAEVIIMMASLLNFRELHGILKALKELCSVKLIDEARRTMVDGFESDDPKKKEEALQLAMLLTTLEMKDKFKNK